MIFDAFGRLAFGQIQQVYIVNVTGVSASGVAGTIFGKAFSSVAASGQAGTITPAVAKTFSGVAATGQVGTMVPLSPGQILGVTGAGVAGTMGDTVSAFMSGVSGQGQAASFVPGTFAAAFCTGIAGQITITVSGGGGKKSSASADVDERVPPRRRDGRVRTGFEPIAKVDPPKPKPLDETIKPPPAEFIRPTRTSEAPSVVPEIMATPMLGDPMALRDQILDAQDITDIMDVLSLLN